MCHAGLWGCRGPPTLLQTGPHTPTPSRLAAGTPHLEHVRVQFAEMVCPEPATSAALPSGSATSPPPPDGSPPPQMRFREPPRPVGGCWETQTGRLIQRGTFWIYDPCCSVPYDPGPSAPVFIANCFQTDGMAHSLIPWAPGLGGVRQGTGDLGDTAREP